MEGRSRSPGRTPALTGTRDVNHDLFVAPPWSDRRSRMLRVGDEQFWVPALIHRKQTIGGWRVGYGGRSPAFLDQTHGGAAAALAKATGWLQANWRPEPRQATASSGRRNRLVKPWHRSQCREVLIPSLGKTCIVPRGVVAQLTAFPSWQVRPAIGPSRAFGARKHGGMDLALAAARTYLKQQYRTWQWQLAAHALCAPVDLLPDPRVCTALVRGAVPLAQERLAFRHCPLIAAAFPGATLVSTEPATAPMSAEDSTAPQQAGWAWPAAEGRNTRARGGGPRVPEHRGNDALPEQVAFDWPP